MSEDFTKPVTNDMERRTRAIHLLDRVGFHPRSGVSLSSAVDVIDAMLERIDVLIADANDVRETCSACSDAADYLSLDDGETWCLKHLRERESRV